MRMPQLWYAQLENLVLVRTSPLYQRKRTARSPHTRQETLAFLQLQSERFRSIKSDGRDVKLSTLRRTKLFSQQTLTSRTLQPEIAIVRTIQMEQRCNPAKPNFDHRSPLCDQRVGTVFFQKVSKQACWRRVPCNAFINAAIVCCNKTSNDDSIQKSLVFFCASSLLIWKDRFNETKQLGRKRWVEPWVARSLLLEERMHLPTSAEPGSRASLPPLSFWVEKGHADDRARASNILLCRRAARQLKENIPARVKCSAILFDMSKRFDLSLSRSWHTYGTELASRRFAKTHK